jgi:hypothetical protein
MPNKTKGEFLNVGVLLLSDKGAVFCKMTKNLKRVAATFNLSPEKEKKWEANFLKIEQVFNDLDYYTLYDNMMMGIDKAIEDAGFGVQNFIVCFSELKRESRISSLDLQTLHELFQEYVGYE